MAFLFECIGVFHIAVDNTYQNILNDANLVLAHFNNGMCDGAGQARPALNVWKNWLNKDLIEN